MMRIIRNNLGLGLIMILTLIPVLIWILMQPLSLRFENSSLILTSIGQIAGLVGVVLFALVLVLNIRTKFLDKIFYGVNNAYVLHHILGAIAFSLLLFHPMALAIKYTLISAQSGFDFLITSDLVIILGELALLLMMFFLILTFFIKLKYQIWKFSHKFLGLAFILASSHVFFISSDVSNNIIMRWYIIVLMCLGLGAILYRVIFPKFLVKKYNYIVDNVREIIDGLVEITMLPKNMKMEFIPGQFIFISFKDETVGSEIHPFSITSASSEESLKITVKNLGDFTSRLKILKKGTEVVIEGPFGKFSYLNYPSNVGQIWIAGGIGITPFLSMARSLNLNDNHNIDLYYCVNTREEMVFLSEFEKISSNIKEFKVVPYCGNESGRISGEFIDKNSVEIKNKEIFICGPLGMMQSLKEQFVRLGVKKYNIHTEEFKMY